MKLKTSPSGAPPSRKRMAKSDRAWPLMTCPARIPAMFAGERRKIRFGAESDGSICSLTASVKRNLGGGSKRRAAVFPSFHFLIDSRHVNQYAPKHPGF